MAVPKALVSLPSSLLMMLAMPSNNSTAMTGRVAHLRYVRIVSLALDQALVVVEAVSAHVEALVLDSAVVEEASEVVVASEVVLEVVVEDMVVDTVEELLAVVSTVVLEALLRLPIPSPTLQPLARREARQSMCATFHGPLATRIS
jgi:hypothetical protein